MNADHPPIETPPGDGSTGRRESARRGVLRANRAVAAILVVVLLLGLAMAGVSYLAHRSQRQAEQAEARATEQLWHSWLSQARAERLSTEAGHRAAALAAISNAAVIRPSVELRSEALASLGLRDLMREVSWPLRPGAYGFHFDPDLEFYVVSYARDELSLFRLADNAPVRTFRSTEAALGTNAAVKEFMFSATGRFVVVQYSTGDVVLWERDSGRAAKVFRGPSADRLAWQPTFSADDRWLCARSGARPDTVLIMEPATDTRRELNVPGVNDSLRLSPRGDQFSWHRGREFFLHDAQTGALRQKLEFTSEVLSCWWDWRGEQFSVWRADSTVHVVDASTGKSRQLGGKVTGPWMQQFSPDGTLLATSGNDGTSRLWDLSAARLWHKRRQAARSSSAATANASPTACPAAKWACGGSAARRVTRS